MNAHSHLSLEEIKNMRVAIQGMTILILFVLVITFISLKTGVAYGKYAKITRENSPIMYWIAIAINIVIVYLFSRELYRTFPYIHEVFP